MVAGGLSRIGLLVQSDFALRQAVAGEAGTEANGLCWYNSRSSQTEC